MRAATALNLLAVLISSEKRHMSNPTLILIVCHFCFLITLQGRQVFTSYHEPKQSNRKFTEQRLYRSEANGGLKHSIVQVLKVDCEKGRKSLRKNTKDFPFPLCTLIHTHTFYSFPFVSQCDSILFLLPSQSHFHACCFPFYLFTN